MGWYTFKKLCCVVICLVTFLFAEVAAKESVTANVREDVTLSCTVNFHLTSSAHIAWKLEDVVIDINGERYSTRLNDETSYLTVRAVTLQDGGNYTCEVRQSSVSSCEIYLSVLAPPTTIILTDSSNMILRDGEKLGQDIDELFSLKCCTGNSGSYPKTQVEWLFSETLTTIENLRSVTHDESDTRISHFCSNITLLTTEEYTGWIICAAFHEGLRRPLYTSITLEVRGFTVLLSGGEIESTLLNGSNVHLSMSKPYSLVCQIERCNKNTTFSWYLDNHPVTTNFFKYGVIRLQNDGAYKSVATFVSPTITLQGKLFKCQVFCGFQAKEIFMTLDVRSHPILVMPGQPLIEFQPTYISCMLNDSLQDHVYRWTIGDEDVTKNATQRLTQPGTSWISILSLLPMKEHNGKLISCKLGKDPFRFDSVQMNVLYGAVISNIQVFPLKLADENSDVNITCDVQSNPIHENVVQWEKFVNGNSKRWIRIRHSSVVLMKNFTWYRWVLQLENVKGSDVGLYRCTATNGIGSFAESDTVHLQLNEMGICLDNGMQFVENEPTTIRCLIKRRTPVSIIRWLINNEEDVTRNATSNDISDDRGRTITESELQFYPLRKYNGKNLTCTSETAAYSGDTIVLNISYCPDQVIFTKCEAGDDTNEILTCESGMSNPPVNLRMENGGIDVTTNVYVTKLNRYKYTGYISSVSATTNLNNILGNITCCSSKNRCKDVCDVCVIMGTKSRVNITLVLVPLSIATFFLAVFLLMFRFYRFHRQNIRDDAVELPECSNSGAMRIDSRPLPHHKTGPEYANSSSGSSEAIYELMKDRTKYVNDSDGVTAELTTPTTWNCLLGYQKVDMNATDVCINSDTYNIPPMFEGSIDDEKSTPYPCDVTSFTGLYQKHVSPMYTTEIQQPVRCELTMKKKISNSDLYSFNAALISRGDIHMKVIVKMLSEAASKSVKCLFIEEVHALETLENHENVIKILGLCSTSTPYCIILEFLGETLHGNLKAMYHSKDEQFQERDEKTHACLKIFSYDVASGLEYLTRKDFTYPRLICQNIFLDDSKHCKLHDFTLREQHVNNLARKHEQDDILVASEVIESGKYTAKSDVWNYGQLLLRIYSFDGLLLAPQAELIESSKPSRNLEYLNLCPNNMRHLISSCCDSSPDNRPCFKKILTDLVTLE